MSLPRFYVPGLPLRGIIELSEAESLHAARVLRSQIGQEVVVFDGCGHQAHAIIESIAKKQVTLRLGEQIFAPRDHGDRLHIAIAMPKGDRQRSTIEHLVELGVDSLTPIETERSVARIHLDNIERLVRYGIESCKQCQRNRCMTVHNPESFQQLFQTRADQSIWLLHPSAPAATHDGNAWDHDPWIVPTLPKRGVLFVIGPEGGLTNDEVAYGCEHGARLLSLGERILRVETAVASAALIGQRWLAATGGVGTSSA